MPKLIDRSKSFNIDGVALIFCKTKFGLCASIKREAVSYKHFYCFIKLRMCTLSMLIDCFTSQQAS